ncbi:hypothetical protein J4573_07000 [Actinomadura barringtoniae]|uniref:Uncharacterized protein n=1 Tax=Actinomadura barringtoniae TaxID=1427535 RepID=A0A939P7A6_9ACTN|nr:hypothetical protein [Actinomadura barringtoniae]MBO2446833.1 hypothetical protein [Actinomadura barringtoniae]
MTADDHAPEVEALRRRYPRWTIWFGLFTGHWWALPPLGHEPKDFVEADTPQMLIARIEVIQNVEPARVVPAPHAVPVRGTGPHRPVTAPRIASDPRRDVRRPSNLLRLEGVTPSPSRRVPVVAWPGSTAR